MALLTLSPVPALENEAALMSISPLQRGRHIPVLSQDGSTRHAAPILLLALAILGMIMNGWDAGSLGSTEIPASLFLASGGATDLVALAIPSCAVGLWQAPQRATGVGRMGVSGH